MPDACEYGRWTVERAAQWNSGRPWVCGFNYIPSSSVNSTEMWQAESFDAKTIRQELKLASTIGLNSCRVFLQYLVWKDDASGMMSRFDQLLDMAFGSGISVVPVLFDDCAFSGKSPYRGRQAAPVPGVHNSQWTPSPGPSAADDKGQCASLESYVKAFISAHGCDERILFWDLYNEPGNSGRFGKSLNLLKQAFLWAREVDPSQPLTAGVWEYGGNHDVESLCVRASDVISYHDYAGYDLSVGRLESAKLHGRPVFCTEWLHRPNGNRVETHLPLFRNQRVGAYHWGLVTGKTQTNLCWSTMSGAPDPHPDEWQHDLFHGDHSPYRVDELAVFSGLARPRNADSERMRYEDQQ